MPRVVLRRSCAPRRASIRDMFRLAVDCDRPMARAPREKLPVSATRRNSCMFSSVSESIVPFPRKRGAAYWPCTYIVAVLPLGVPDIAQHVVDVLRMRGG